VKLPSLFAERAALPRHLTVKLSSLCSMHNGQLLTTPRPQNLAGLVALGSSEASRTFVLEGPWGPSTLRALGGPCRPLEALGSLLASKGFQGPWNPLAYRGISRISGLLPRPCRQALAGPCSLASEAQ